MQNQILSFLPEDHPWKNSIEYFPTITSTNDVLKLMASQGAPHGTVLVAGHQTGGRGRLGRTFLSPPDVGIYMSVLLRPECTPDQLMHLTCAAAVAACNAIEKAAGFRPGIKWTNDLVFQKRKLAGILTELSFGSNQSIDYAIIGIGINCNQRTEDFPEDIRKIAGSLSMSSGKTVDRAEVAAAMIEAFSEMDSKLFCGRDTIMTAYRNDCITLGQEVSVVRGDSIRHGKALDIDQNGGLVVCYSDQNIETVSSGEVSVRGLYNYV